MNAYIVRRLLTLILILFGMSLMTFVITRVVPSDPAQAIAGVDAKPEAVQTIRKELGLDRPLHEQYWRYISHLVRGDLGLSFLNRQPVIDDIKTFLPASFELAVVSLLICVPLGILMGVITALKAGSWSDAITRIFAILGISTPIFWLALLFQLLFYRQLHWFPAAGRLGVAFTAPPTVTGLYLIDTLLAGDFGAFRSTVHHIVMPSFTLAVANIAVIARMTRSSLLEVLSADYVRTARSKGLSERVVLGRHALKSAMVPVITIIGLQLGALIAWVFLVEAIFSWPGIGSYTVRAIMNSDFNAVMGVTLMLSVMFVIINLLVDMSYLLLDPRIRY